MGVRSEGITRVHDDASGGSPISIADGSDVSLGATTDAAAVAGAAGTVQAKLRTISDTLGATTAAKVITDANGTVQQYLRGIVTLLIGTLSVGVASWTAAVYALVKRAGYENATWSTNHAPAANTKATITRAATGSASTRNVCTGLTVSICGGATAPAAIQLTVALIDGDTGGGTYLWGPHVIALPAVAGSMAAFVRSDLWIPGTLNTKMTLEFSAAGGANTTETVSMEGTTST